MLSPSMSPSPSIHSAGRSRTSIHQDCVLRTGPSKQVSGSVGWWRTRNCQQVRDLLSPFGFLSVNGHSQRDPEEITLSFTSQFSEFMETGP